jgi:hypothetical protein
MNTDEFKLNDKIAAESYTVEGVTADHVWYSANLLSQKMSFWELDFKKLTKTMEDRHNEHLKIISDLLDECKSLKRQLSALQAQNKE